MVQLQRASYEELIAKEQRHKYKTGLILPASSLLDTTHLRSTGRKCLVNSTKKAPVLSKTGHLLGVWQFAELIHHLSAFLGDKSSQKQALKNLALAFTESQAPLDEIYVPTAAVKVLRYCGGGSPVDTKYL